MTLSSILEYACASLDMLTRTQENELEAVQHRATLCPMLYCLVRRVVNSIRQTDHTTCTNTIYSVGTSVGENASATDTILETT